MTFTLLAGVLGELTPKRQVKSMKSLAVATAFFCLVSVSAALGQDTESTSDAHQHEHERHLSYAKTSCGSEGAISFV